MSDSLTCVECGSVPANHTLLWLDSISDALTLQLPAYKLPFYRYFLALAEWLTTFLGAAAFYIGRTIGAVTLTEDEDTAVSDRSKLLWLEAKRRGIPMQQILVLGKSSDTFRVMSGRKHHFFTSLPLYPEASLLRMDDKIFFKERMRSANIPVPSSSGVRTYEDARNALKEYGAVCVKPRTGSNGRHTYPYVKNEEELKTAFSNVKEISVFVSIEEHLEGNLCRATCVDGVLIGFLQSEYLWIVGNGASSVSELIQKANSQKVDGVDDIVLDASTLGYIRRRGYSPQSVIPEGTRLQITYRGGTGAGGSNREHGRNIHPSFIEPIERAAKATGLDVVGFDIIIPDAQKPANEQHWGFIEANTLPWIDLHAHPFYGEPIDLSPAVWDLWEKKHRA